VMQGYHYIVEIRGVLEKHKLREITSPLYTLGIPHLHRVPHITLIYNFKPLVEDKIIAEKIAQTATQYNYLGFTYQDYVERKGPKGSILALDVKPTKELMAFRQELYDNIKQSILEAPSREAHNKTLWWHAAITYGAPERDVKRALKELKGFYFPAQTLRISLVHSGKIRFEYDTLSRTLLNQSGALSKERLTQTYTLYREKYLKLDISRNKLEKIWLVSDTHFDHTNIIKYTARPFTDVEEMNKYIKERWSQATTPSTS
jgi:hypothetical protein